MEDNSGKRLGYIDVARGIGIVCVMLGHLGVEVIDRVVFTFHMPLFFLLSGYFINSDIIFPKFVKQKAKKLLVPYYVTGCLTCCLIALADIVRGLWDNIIPDFLSELIAMLYGVCFDVSDSIPGIGAIWFLWALFWAVILVKILSKCKNAAVYIVFAFIISCISSQNIWLPLSMQPGVCAAFFVYFGYYLKKLNLEEYLNRWKLVLISIIVFCGEILLGINVNMSNNTYIYGPESVIGALLICYFILYISYIIYISFPKLRKILTFFGKNSLIVLCVHQIEMKVFPWSLVLFALNEKSNPPAMLGRIV